ncbi:ATP-binding response regulator [Anaeromyxobacter terrae]|uniref:ATP-binding response regulator n=1 Tax=Anaeromyxobacter terrae TaxID=2925406 RepID=UPI001F578131|nr:HD domain-containing phosphohydrolase [Anaeromyxobacter sp. SG22]
MSEQSTASERHARRPLLDRRRVLAALFPEVLLDGTPWRAQWRGHEDRLIVLYARVALVSSIVGQVLHHFLVDLPLELTPASRWATYRFGSSVFYALLLAATFLPRLQRGLWARAPLFLLTLVVSCLQALTVVWLPSVSYLYAFVFGVVGVLLLRQSAPTAVATLLAVFTCEWAFAWRHTDIHPARLFSVLTMAIGLVLLFRARMATDVRAFLTSRRERQAQQQLLATQVELDRVKTNFFTNVSHDLRTPLTLIIAPLEAMMSEAGGVSAEVRADLELMLRNAQRLLRQINTLLDLSRLDAKHEFLRLEDVDVVELLGSLVESGRPLAAQRHVSLALAVDGPVPPLPVDRDKLEKVVLNLLSNAIRFTDGTDARPGAVTVRCGVRGDRFFCSVEDTGIGIPDDQIERVFDRFHQVEGPAARGRGGTGIGLALVRQLAEFHMGSVAVRSRVGEGSCFTLELPTDRAAYPPERIDRRQEHQPVPVDRRRPAQPAAVALHLEGARPPPRPIRLTPSPATRASSGTRPLILVVDDNRELLDFVARQLADEFRVRVAERAAEALRMAAVEPPALVLSDVMMPGGSGTDLLRELRRDARLRHVPVILVTAKADLESKIENLREGADDYLAKPFSVAELRARIRSLLEKRKLAVELAEKNEYLAKLNFDLVLSKRQVFLETMEAFALAVEAKDPYTHGHSRRVSLLAERVARELGLSEAECETIRIAGILHDLGKIGTPEAVLVKPGKVTPEEYAIFKRHSQMGWRIVSAVKELDGVARAILHHHERFDGAGYPDGLAGMEIPPLSRVLAVCDTYDAMTSDRPYRAGIEHRLAVEEILRCSGSQLDPECVQAFLRLYEDAAPQFPDFPSGLHELANPDLLGGGAS